MAFSMGCPLFVLGCSDNSPAIYDGVSFQQIFSSWSASSSSDSGLETGGGAVVYYADSLTLTMSDGSKKFFKKVYYWFEGDKLFTSHNDFEYVKPPIPSWIARGKLYESFEVRTDVLPLNHYPECTQSTSYLEFVEEFSYEGNDFFVYRVTSGFWGDYKDGHAYRLDLKPGDYLIIPTLLMRSGGKDTYWFSVAYVVIS